MPPLKAPSRSLETLTPDDVKAKIQAVEALAQSKTRALMRSIDRLTKENLALKSQSQEHRRSETFKKIESEMGIQDVIIMALTGELSKIHGMSYVEEKINEVLHRGQPRLVSKSRQELIHENAVLRQRIVSLSKREKEEAGSTQNVPVIVSEAVSGEAQEDENERDEILFIQKRKLDAVEKENTSLMVELESNKKLLKQQEDIISLAQRSAQGKNDFQREVAQYEGQIHLLQNKLARKEEQHENTKRQIVEVGAAEKKLAQEKIEHLTLVEQLKAELQTKLDDQAIQLNKKLHDVIKSKEEKERQVDTLQQRNKKLNAESKVAKTQVEEAVTRLDEEISLKMQIQTKLEADLEKSHKNAQVLQDQLDRFDQEQSAKVKSYEDQMSILNESKEKELAAQKALLEEKIRQIHVDMTAEKSHLEEREKGSIRIPREEYAAMQKERENLEAQLRNKDQELQKQKDSDDKSCPSCRIFRDEKQKMEAKHEKQMEELEARHKKRQADNPLEDELEQYREKVDELQYEIETLKAKLKGTGKNLELAQKKIQREIGSRDEF